MRLRAHVLPAVLAATVTGCITRVSDQCPTCRVVSQLHPSPPRFRPGTRAVFVLIPGILGFGWEWDAGIAALRHARDTDFVVFWWEPWNSLRTSAAELEHSLNRIMLTAPESVGHIIVIAHSAGGMVAAQAIGPLQVPGGRRLRLVTVGTPFAGMKAWPFTLDDPIHSPLAISIIGSFRRYPAPPPGVEVIEYITHYPPDPVMQPRFGHRPDDPEVGPRGAERVCLPENADHNRVLVDVIAEQLRALHLR